MPSQNKGNASDYELRVLGGPILDAVNDNVDVEIRFKDGRRYTPTFFTIGNIRSLFEKNRATGECLNGLFLWAADMIIVESLSMDTIRSTVAELIRTGELDKACKLLD